MAYTTQIPAGQFKAKCLQLMDEVQHKHKAYTITKYGKPVAKLVPIDEAKAIDLFGCMAGTCEIVGDIIAPIDEPWNAEQ
ncbi:MAG: type II toxin-antitoxin system prevent-host-death family antitoxin [Gammaproteobacteria bacterium]|nr:type II toxin-antitoxin system prevent-host-death family antitoxin [Gammaproteobacteria bacterium]